MINRTTVFATCILLGATGATTASAQVLPDADADVVFVRQNCAVDGVGLANCVEGLEFLTRASGESWLWDVRQPSATDRVMVDVGPGEYPEGFFCPDTAGAAGRSGWVSVRGQGRSTTTIGSDQMPTWYGARISNCEGLDFSNLTMLGALTGVLWAGGGSATWSDVDFRGSEDPIFLSWGWFDTCVDPSETDRSQQAFFGSTVHGFGGSSGGTAAFWTGCADSRFYGGDIQLLYKTQGVTDGPNRRAGAAVVSGHATMEVFGSSIRVGNLVALVDRSASLQNDRLFGVTVDADSASTGEPSFRMHGGIISLNAKYGDTHTVGLRVIGENAYANTMGTAFVLNPHGEGTAQRLVSVDEGKIEAPLLWQAGVDPPSSKKSALQSLDGQGLFVETDCEADGQCSSGWVSESHVMVYDTSCSTPGEAPQSAGAGPWRNMMTKRCRGVDPNTEAGP